MIEELINEKLKIQLLKRYTIPDIDKDVDNALTNMARRCGRRQGVHRPTGQQGGDGGDAEHRA